MIRRYLKLTSSEFTDVLELETNWETSPHCMFIVRIRVPINSWNFVYGFNFSCEASRGVVPNQISKELFHLMNFLEQDDWRDKLDSYADFCDGRL